MTNSTRRKQSTGEGPRADGARKGGKVVLLVILLLLGSAALQPYLRPRGDLCICGVRWTDTPGVIRVAGRAEMPLGGRLIHVVVLPQGSNDYRISLPAWIAGDGHTWGIALRVPKGERGSLHRAYEVSAVAVSDEVSLPESVDAGTFGRYRLVGRSVPIIIRPSWPYPRPGWLVVLLAAVNCALFLNLCRVLTSADGDVRVNTAMGLLGIAFTVAVAVPASPNRGSTLVASSVLLLVSNIVFTALVARRGDSNAKTDNGHSSNNTARP